MSLGVVEGSVLSRGSRYAALGSNGSQTHPRRVRGRAIIMESLFVFMD